LHTRSSLLQLDLPALPHATSTLLPYTTLFRSEQGAIRVGNRGRVHRRVHLSGIDGDEPHACSFQLRGPDARQVEGTGVRFITVRSEEHTSELQSRGHLVCRLLLEKKKKE